MVESKGFFVDDQQTLQVSALRALTQTQVQFCFVIDSTGSMDNYIKILKQSLLGVFDTFEQLQLSERVQIGFVFYRDFSEDDNEYIKALKLCKKEGWKPQKKLEWIEFQTFTKDSASPKGQIYGYLEDLSNRCDGGDDCAEDIAGGLRKMLELKWILPSQQNQGPTRIAVLITDAPCHGKEFHTGVLDNFEDLTKKPEADIRPLLNQMIEKNINLSIIQIHSRTEKMNEEIKNFYDQKNATYKFQSLKLTEDLSKLEKQQNQQLDSNQINILAQILLERLQLSIKRFRK